VNRERFVGVARREARDTLSALKALRYRGNRYEDPICGRHVNQMLATSSGRPDALCPGCRSAERHRLLWLYLDRELNITTERLRVLHVAPERGIERRLRSLRHLDYVTTDLMDRTAMVRADLTALPFPDQSFDLVLCNHVLEHIPDDVAAMGEIRRVLRSMGQAVMQHPIDINRAVTFEDWSVTSPEERQRVFFQVDHVRIYGQDFADRLTAAGFGSVETLRYQDRLTSQERLRHRTDQLPSRHPERDLEADRIYVSCR
jgi:SAM-dependent methyltransferase